MKALKIAGIVIGAVALTATGIGIALGAGTAAAGTLAGVSAATFASIGAIASVASGVLGVVSAFAKPKFSVQGSPTTFSTNPQSGLPYAMGRTRMSGLRIYAETNTRPGYTKFDDLLWFAVLLSAGGQIDSIEKFTGDNVTYTFNGSTGQVSGDLANYMAQKVHLGGPQASAIALSLMSGAAPGWTSAHRLSGMTHAMWALRFDKDGEKLAGGVPEPSWVGKWVRVYDPRKDSTYPGGSGSHRALDETTYEWSDNPALHALTWALGRWQNGKRTLGIGAPVNNIRVGDFVEMANVCDTNGWKMGGVEWSTDSKWDIFKRMLQAGGAVPTMTGAMIGCRVKAPRIPIATIEATDLLDKLEIATTRPRKERFNTAIPRFRDEDSDWEVVSGAPISVGDYVTADGGQRTKEIDLPLVQRFTGETARQAGQLAAYEIVDSREAGPISFTTGPEWLGLKSGDCVTLNVPEEGLDAQSIVILEASLDPATTKITFTAETETTAKHAFALGQTTTPPPPFALTAPDLTPPAPDAGLWSLSTGTVGLGYPAIIVQGASEYPAADSVLIRYRVVSAADWHDAGKLPATGAIRHAITPVAGGASYEVGVAYAAEERIGPYTTLGPITASDDGFGLLLADAIATNDRARAIFWQETAPSASESEPNDLWIRKSTGVTYIRVAGSGRLAVGGRRFTVGGSHVTLCWAEVADQRIGQALLAAAGAQAAADGKVDVFTMFTASDPVPVGIGVGDLLIRAYLVPPQIDHWNGSTWISAATYGATAEQAADIEAMAFDGILSKLEKVKAIDQWEAVNREYTAQNAKAIALAVAATERGNAASKLSSLGTYLSGLSPAWNDTTTDTVIVPATYRGYWNDVYTANAVLAAAVLGAPTGTPVGTISAGDVSGTIKSGGGLNTNQVDTASVQNNAISDVVGAFTDGTVASTSAETVAQSASVVVGSTGSVIVLMSCLWSGSNSAPSMIYGGLIRLYRNGSMLREWTGMGGGNGFQGNFSSSLVDAPGSGTHGYELRILNLAGGTAQFDASKRSLGLVYQKK